MGVAWERDSQLPADDTRSRFDRLIVPHLDAAYNLARWLLGNAHEAEDAVQEAFLRAYRFFASFQGTDGRSWLLTIVRNHCYTWLEKNRGGPRVLSLPDDEQGPATRVAGPQEALAAAEDRQLVHQALEKLSLEYREVIVLRELEGLSYQEIAAVAAMPLGTVMSRLARARAKLAEILGPSKDPTGELR